MKICPGRAAAAAALPFMSCVPSIGNRLIIRTISHSHRSDIIMVFMDVTDSKRDDSLADWTTLWCRCCKSCASQAVARGNSFCFFLSRTVNKKSGRMHPFGREPIKRKNNWCLEGKGYGLMVIERSLCASLSRPVRFVATCSESQKAERSKASYCCASLFSWCFDVKIPSTYENPKFFLLEC